MLKPYSQGQLDLFCAAYAVINALVLVRRIRFETARDLLADTLLHFSKKPEIFEKLLKHQVEFYYLVDEMLEKAKKDYKISVLSLQKDKKLPASIVWHDLKNFLNAPGRTAIVRFERMLALPNNPIINHWTTVEKVENDCLIFFDGSREAEALRKISYEDFLLEHRGLAPGLVFVDKNSLRLIGG